MECCICGKKIKGYGNNPAGAAWKDENGEVVLPEFDSEHVCCDECNAKYVIPGRLYRMTKKGK